MKMTEKMKQELEEVMQKEGVELSEEELDEVSGGRGLTQIEYLTGKNYFCPQNLKMSKRYAIGYCQYIESLPEGSPQVEIKRFVSKLARNGFCATYKCPNCGATVTDPMHGDYPICSECGRKINISDVNEISRNYFEKLR